MEYNEHLPKNMRNDSIEKTFCEHGLWKHECKDCKYSEEGIDMGKNEEIILMTKIGNVLRLIPELSTVPIMPIAKLICDTTAAPELLEACKDILSFLQSHGYDTRIIKQAIKKAEGK